MHRRVEAIRGQTGNSFLNTIKWSIKPEKPLNHYSLNQYSPHHKFPSKMHKCMHSTAHDTRHTTHYTLCVVYYFSLMLFPHVSATVCYIKVRCSKCDVVVVHTEMVWCWNCSNMSLLVYMLVWCTFKMKCFAQDSLIHLGDTCCSQWFREVVICNKPKTGDQ